MRNKLALAVVFILTAISQAPCQKIGASGGVNEEIKTEHLTVTLSQTQTIARTGTTVSLIADIAMPPGMHIYAPGVKGYTSTTFNLDANPAVNIHPSQYPKSARKLLPAIRQRVPVFEGRAKIVRDVTIVSPAVGSQIDLTGVLEYQACDDQICYVPRRVPVRFSIRVE